jgi:hypothetical protein
VLVANPLDHLFVLLVEEGKEALFDRYARSQRLRVLAWIDTDGAVQELRERLTATGEDGRDRPAGLGRGSE